MCLVSTQIPMSQVQVNHVESLGLAQSCNVATFCAIIEIKFLLL